MSSNNRRVHFREEQAFRQLWIQLLLLGLTGLAAWAAIQQLVLGKPFGDNPASDGLLILFALVFGVGFPLMFFSLKLTVEVREDHVYIRFRPFTTRIIPMSEIQCCEARTYRPIREYGGWGIRWSWRNGRAYNISGNRGVQLVLRNGKRVLIGSQKAEQLSFEIENRLTKTL